MISKELAGASARPLLLSILAEGETYGYAIIQRVKALSAGQIAWKDGTLYPVLHRLEDEGLIASTWRVADTGRKRRYYALTPQGQQVLAAERRQWLRVDAVLAQLWGLEPRLAI
ncbi:MAG: PadR family transcriptional regulator [Bacteroidota bacterium]